MDQVDDYLWEVYQRAPIKKDGTGDFTWKDLAAAKHMGLSLAELWIGGMDPEFREQLYHVGQVLSAFRVLQGRRQQFVARRQLPEREMDSGHFATLCTELRLTPQFWGFMPKSCPALP